MKIKCNKLIEEALRLKTENTLLDQKIEKLEEKKANLEQLMERRKEQIETKVILDSQCPETIADDAENLLQQEIAIPSNNNTPIISQEQMIDMIEALKGIYDDYKSERAINEQDSMENAVVGTNDEVIVIYEHGAGKIRTIINCFLLIIALALIGAAILFFFDFIGL